MRAAQIDASGGRVETTMSRSTIRLTAAANGVDALRTLPLPLLGGASVPLGEVATVEDAHADRTSLAYQGVEG